MEWQQPTGLGGSCQIPAAWMFCVSAARLMYATGDGADCDRRPGEGGCVSVFREGCAVREYWRRLRPPSRELSGPESNL